MGLGRRDGLSEGLGAAEPEGGDEIVLLACLEIRPRNPIIDRSCGFFFLFFLRRYNNKKKKANTALFR